MRFRQSPEDQEAAEITRLVDAAAGDASSPVPDAEIRRQVAGQRRVARELRTGGPDVPDRLVRTVEAKVREAYGTNPTRPRRAASIAGWRPTIAIAGLAIVVAAVVIATVGTGGTGPSIPAAAQLAYVPATGPAPGVRSATLLDASYGGVTYPNYGKFAVPPTGTRRDRIGGRPALTVFYGLPNGTRLSYTVFSGKAVPLPASARSVVFEGVPLKVFRTSSGLSVVTLVRFGRTCVLAAHTSPDVVLGLAAAPVLAQRAA